MLGISSRLVSMEIFCKVIVIDVFVALFGRPPIIHLRDCDVTEPLIVDDENLTPEGIKDESIDSKSRMCAFVATIRLHVILEVFYPSYL